MENESAGLITNIENIGNPEIDEQLELLEARANYNVLFSEFLHDIIFTITKETLNEITVEYLKSR